MKVLLVVTGMSMGGAEKVVADLADAFVTGGDEVRIVYLQGPQQVHPRRPEVELVSLGMDSAKGILAGFLKFGKILREFKPDIVHTHMYHATMLARLMRLLVQFPHMISTSHSALDGGRVRAVAYRLTDWLTDISTNVSCEAVDAFVASGAVPAHRMIAIHNGIDVDKFRASPAARDDIRRTFSVAENCKLFVAAGRLGWSKDYPNMFNALVRLPKDLDYKLLIAGGGELRPQLEKQVEDLGLSSRVHFLGIRDDIAELMSAADVFVLSSVGEGFGLVVAEAMACECVVVATDSGGVREVLGDPGFLVPSQDPDALAAAIVSALSLSKADAIALGKAARRRVVETYSFDRSVEKWRDLYGNLLAGMPGGVTAPRDAGPMPAPPGNATQ
jgi:glycosyltransferase involved in cell wall biosynthesis